MLGGASPDAPAVAASPLSEISNGLGHLKSLGPPPSPYPTSLRSRQQTEREVHRHLCRAAPPQHLGPHLLHWAAWALSRRQGGLTIAPLLAGAPPRSRGPGFHCSS